LKARLAKFYSKGLTLSELMNKPIKYNTLIPDMYLEKLKERGLMEDMAGQIQNSMLDIKNGQEEMVSLDLENKLGRKPH
jgi:NAD(P)H dehydrogenase (quinone)